MATPNPLAGTDAFAPVSAKTFYIAGIATVVYGLSELPPNPSSISCLWLLHPRLQTKDIMASVAASCISDWNSRPSSDKKASVGLIAVAFDQRNHGSRLVNATANDAWRDGNATHAQDMFRQVEAASSRRASSVNQQQYLPWPDDPPISQHSVMGISLGGHAAWQVLFNEPRVTAGVVVIGCPDYTRVMTDRARLSKLATYTSSPTPGSSFLGSIDFPQSLLTSISKSDPRGLLFSTSEIPSPLSEPQQAQLRPILDSSIRNKKILVCSGGADKLVPYHCSKPFLDFLKGATGEDGWYRDGNVYLEDKVYEGIGHAYSEGMARDTTRFISEFVAGSEGGQSKL